MPNPIDEAYGQDTSFEQKLAEDVYDAMHSCGTEQIDVLLNRLPALLTVARIDASRADMIRRLLSIAASRMVPDGLPDEFHERRYAPILRVLSTRPMTSMEIAGAIGEMGDQTNHKLGALKTMGAIDTRREGTTFKHTLTEIAVKALALAEAASKK